MFTCLDPHAALDLRDFSQTLAAVVERLVPRRHVPVDDTEGRLTRLR